MSCKTIVEKAKPHLTAMRHEHAQYNKMFVEYGVTTEYIMEKETEEG